MSGKLLIIGFGPGSFEHITKRAREAIQESEVIIGYNTYVDLIAGLLTEQQVVRTGMTEEVSRAQEAVRQAKQGKKVAVISSGDAGVYGMAGLVYEVLMEQGWTREDGVQVEVIPGISAVHSAGSLLGAPIMHDSCTISLSDHLTPWELIAKRVEAAGMADFVIALYNPRSGRRTRQIVETQRILLKHRSPLTPVGIVKSAYRDREHVVVTTLADMLNHDIGMLTTIIIGNSATKLYEGLMITPRGYQRKYTLGAETQPLKPHQRLKSEAEPWALEQLDEQDWDESMEDFDEDDELMDDEVTESKEPSLLKSSPNLSPSNSLQLAMEALQLVSKGTEVVPFEFDNKLTATQSIFEFAVSPGIANKKLTAAQLCALGEIVGDRGDIEYSPHHQLIVRVQTNNPKQITSELSVLGLLLSPIGDVAQIKACDFCNLEKGESIPYAEAIHNRIGNLEVPKELKIGFNGCGMACYGAVQQDIGIVYRKEKFDLFLGGKTVGRNAHAAQPVAEGIDPEELVGLVGRIVERYQKEGHPNERFHKYFKRVKEIEGYRHQEMVGFVIENAICGD
ncbi:MULTISPECIES: precorrin-3B C(17)-methyltransferase [unclassified Paenibacillus]|uniref:precorrin-3B C(17)-methyltransferase n=1 Tax=unclassified Paenibacillus TaxID=185978 RepID=UPI000710DF82|nr:MULTISPECIES: precorrin-3B C(17)-methyltransferase [unclassified Paenibacillus]KQX46450.1 cobalt-precorrin-3B C(17)-methyltransferase [Paenibacillus sp. Root444D2]KRE33362.1 cobalt-precorrin-3B C(17)-methyltransferase [Paenibacillus sp. Soil724D2]